MLLSSFVQTHSIQNALKPIAEKVGKLLQLTEEPRQGRFSELNEPAEHIKTAVQKLIQAGLHTCESSSDEQFQHEMKVACSHASKSAQGLKIEVQKISASTSLTNCSGLYTSVEGILEGTMKVLLAWDDSEVRRIIRTAQWSLDRLRLVEAARSMRGLLVCYTGFTESMTLLLQLANGRQKDMTIESQRDRVLACLDMIRENLPQFSQAVQDYVQNPSNEEYKEMKARTGDQVSSAILGIMDAVKKEDSSPGYSSSDEISETGGDYIVSETASDTMATHILKVQTQLSPNHRFEMDPDLDRYIERIIANVMKVAQVSKPHYKDAIIHLGDEVIQLRQDLGIHLKELQKQPTSQQAKATFNKTAEDLCLKLLELDKVVAQSVADQVAETFVDPSSAINNLISAAVAPPPPSYHPPDPDSEETISESSSDTQDDLQKKVKVFRRHSRKLSEVALQAAQGTLDRKRAKKIQGITDELTDLTNPVVSTALRVNKDPNDQDEQQKLHDLRRQWAEKVQKLTTAIDEIIGAWEFTAASEANIVDDMTQCREAIVEQNWVELVSAVHNIAAKARRVSEVAKTRLDSIKDHQQRRTVKEALTKLEASIATMIERANHFIAVPGDEQALKEFVQSLELILTNIHNVQAVLPPSIPMTTTAALSLGTHTPLHMTTHRPFGVKEPKSTSTPISQTPMIWATDLSGSGFNRDISPFLNSDDRSSEIPFGVSVTTIGTSIGTQFPKTTSTSIGTHITGTSIGTHITGTSIGTQVPKTTGTSIGTQVPKTTGTSIGTQVLKTTGTSIGTQMETSMNTSIGTQMEPPGSYRTLSPSDEWITNTSTKETSPSLFAPTDPSSSREYVDSQFKEDAFTQTPHPVLKDEALQAIQYPSSLGGQSITPSLLWQSDFSHTSELEKHVEIPKSDNLLLSSYAQPLKKVLTAATQGDITQLTPHVSALSARALRLSKMAEFAATTTEDPNLARVLEVESARLSYITPQLIRKAKQTVQDGGQDFTDLENLSHQWAGHVRTLLNASQKANMPWSQLAGRLVSSARKRKGLEKEIAHISTQTERMVNVATSTIEAATTEDAIGSTGNLEHQPDPDVQNQIEHVHGHITDIETITPTFITTAEEVAKKTKENSDEDKLLEETIASEQLNILSHEWATKANALMKGVDDITIGMSGPPDSLLISANSNDPALLDEQICSITNLASSMMKISEDAVQGCNDEERVDLVLNTAKLLQDLSSELVVCAKQLVSMSSDKRGGEEHQLLVEKAEILRRDWSAKMHLLTAHIDDLTAGVAGPLDRLVSVALQASRTEGMAKDHLMGQFENKSSFVIDQLEVVSTKLREAISSTTSSDVHLQNCSRALAFMDKLSPRAMGAARSLSTDPGSAKLDHFSHLRRQWASKAQNFRANLHNVEETDVTDVVFSFEELLQGHKTIRRSISPPSFRRIGTQTDKDEDEEESVSPTSRSSSYSNEDIEPPPVPCSPPIQIFDKSDFQEPPVSKPLRHSEPSTPERPIDTSQNPQLVLRYPHSHTPNRSKRLSMGTFTHGEDEDIMDSSLNGSSASIAIAARTLQEIADQFMEEGNPLIALAKKMSSQMFQMAEFARGRGELQTKSDMIHTAKAIAANAEQLVRNVNAISEQCLDKRMKTNLQYCAEMIPTLSTQLRIIASVKDCNPDDASADIMLVKNAQNLMQAVIKTIQAAEAAYVKGLKSPENAKETETAALAIQWKRKLYLQRTMEAISAPLGAKGLRRLNRNRFSTPTLADLIQTQKGRLS